MPWHLTCMTLMTCITYAETMTFDSFFIDIVCLHCTWWRWPKTPVLLYYWPDIGILSSLSWLHSPGHSNLWIHDISIRYYFNDSWTCFCQPIPGARKQNFDLDEPVSRWWPNAYHLLCSVHCIDLTICFCLTTMIWIFGTGPDLLAILIFMHELFLHWLLLLLFIVINALVSNLTWQCNLDICFLMKYSSSKTNWFGWWAWTGQFDMELNAWLWLQQMILMFACFAE